MYQISADFVNRELRNATFEGKKHQTQPHRSHACLANSSNKFTPLCTMQLSKEIRRKLGTRVNAGPCSHTNARATRDCDGRPRLLPRPRRPDSSLAFDDNAPTGTDRVPTRPLLGETRIIRGPKQKYLGVVKSSQRTQLCDHIRVLL